jgi:hypothetical protein
MRIDKTHKIELVASTDTTRTALCALHLNAEPDDDGRGHLVATNGHMLVKLPAELCDDDTTGPIAPQALKAARKLAKGDEKLGVKANGSLVLIDGSTQPRRDVGQYPPYKQVIPSNERKTVTVGLNAEYLWRLCQALGGSKAAAFVKLEIPVCEKGEESTLDPLVVRRSDSDGLGVLMPCRL